MSDIDKIENTSVADPGLPEHQYRPTDVEPKLENWRVRSPTASLSLWR